MDPPVFHSTNAEIFSIGPVFRTTLVGAVVIAVLMLVLLVLTSENTQWLASGGYATLIWSATSVAGVLCLLVLELIRRLFRSYRMGLFGTRLMARMALSFVLMTILPVGLVYLVSVHFVTRSIESWFNVPVDHGLQAGLDLGRAVLDSKLDELLQKARFVATGLSEVRSQDWPISLNGLRERVGVQDAILRNALGHSEVISVNHFRKLLSDPLPAHIVQQVKITGQYTRFESPDDGDSQGDLTLRAIVRMEQPMVGSKGFHAYGPLFLELIDAAPVSLSKKAQVVEQAYKEFQQLLVWRDGLRRLFGVSLTLTLLLTASSAVASSFLISGWLTGPLSMLAAGTRAVAQGDYRPVVGGYAGRDELGLLTEEFNAMTRQLTEARGMVQRNQRALEQVNDRLESILSNLTAGVLVFDLDFNLALANTGAEQILGVALVSHYGRSIQEVEGLKGFAAELVEAFGGQAGSKASWQKQFIFARSTRGSDGRGAKGGERKSHSPPADERILLARGAMLPDQGVEHIVVFDDITALVSDQRASAWAEVARRVAHEIKNPLTPIQLAAERMRRKLASKLPDSEAVLLEKSTQTIVDQVSALKYIVDEFRDYARLPAADLALLNLNSAIEDVLSLYFSGDLIRAVLAPELPMVYADKNQVRQLLHNLVKNAQEAVESVKSPVVELMTDITLRRNGERAVRVRVRDNGGGFSEASLARVFEPYVTTKRYGTGLGLAIVKKIADEHSALVDVENWCDSLQNEGPVGAQVSVLFTRFA